MIQPYWTHSLYHYRLSIGWSSRERDVHILGWVQWVQPNENGTKGLGIKWPSWGVFVATVMMFGLKNTPATFQRMVQEILYDYLTDFMKVFVDDFNVLGENSKHLFHLRLCLQRCRDIRLKLNLAKCDFVVRSRALLGYIVSKQGLTYTHRRLEL